MPTVPLTAIFQSAIRPDMQGRVFSLISAGATAMMPLSLLIAGPVSDSARRAHLVSLWGHRLYRCALAGMFIPAIVNIETNNQENA